MGKDIGTPFKIISFLRNFFAIPIAATLGIFAPGIYLAIVIGIESFIAEWFPFFSSTDGYIFFFIPAVWFWIYVQSMFAGALGGLTTLYIALKISKEKNNIIYISLFLTSLLVNSISVYGNIVSKELSFAIPGVIANLIAFYIAGIIPLQSALKNAELKL